MLHAEVTPGLSRTCSGAEFGQGQQEQLPSAWDAAGQGRTPWEKAEMERNTAGNSAFSWGTAAFHLLLNYFFQFSFFFLFKIFFYFFFLI